MGRILGVLAKCLVPWRESHMFVLVLAVASMHINPSVIRQARRLGVNLLFVPAEVTHLQHPLDTHGFALLKAWLRASYQELRQLSEDGEVTLSAWAKLFMQAPRNVFAKRRWESALTATGVLPGSVPLTRKLQGLVGSTMPSSCRTDQPTDADLKYIWPKRCRLEGFAHLLFGEVAESLPRISPRAASHASSSAEAPAELSLLPRRMPCLLRPLSPSRCLLAGTRERAGNILRALEAAGRQDVMGTRHVDFHSVLMRVTTTFVSGQAC